ncbi:MAG: Do family serine endopeptidase, partial [Nitrospinales bacterium]
MIFKVVKIPIIVAIFIMLAIPISRESRSELSPLLENASALSAASSPLGSNIFVEIAKKYNPAVVNVSTKVKQKQRPNLRPPGRGPRGPDPFKDFYDRFFGDRDNRPRRGMGSGLIIDAEGHVLTNNHVVHGADIIKVKLENEKEYDAKLIGSDSKTDIALIKILREKGDTTQFPFLTMGDSDKLEVGEWVVAIGNPFGLSHTVTVGVVSAKGRQIGAGPYDDFIQTDASINPGNSGGPLFNVKGEVIGINTAIISGNAGGNVGIGFAIPINLAKDILRDLKEKGAVTRGWLGVMIQKITPDLAKSFGLKESEGALVGDVIPDSPASDAGVKVGDVIVKYDNKNIKTMEELPRVVAGTRPGETVKIDVIRDGKRKTIPITIALLKDQDEEEKLASLGDQMGLQVQNITPELAQSLNLEDTVGVLVSNVAP